MEGLAGKISSSLHESNFACYNCMNGITSTAHECNFTSYNCISNITICGRTIQKDYHTALYGWRVQHGHGNRILICGLRHRVPTLPGKFWKVLDFFCKISRPWKFLENGFGPGNFSGKSLNFFLGYDAGGRHSGVGVGADAEICACAHLYRVTELLSYSQYSVTHSLHISTT